MATGSAGGTVAERGLGWARLLDVGKKRLTQVQEFRFEAAHEDEVHLHGVYTQKSNSLAANSCLACSKGVLYLSFKALQWVAQSIWQAYGQLIPICMGPLTVENENEFFRKVITMLSHVRRQYRSHPRRHSGFSRQAEGA